VNIWNSSGTKVRKADATTAGEPARLRAGGGEQRGGSHPAQIEYAPEQAFRRGGLPRDRARRVALAVISAVEGALLPCRARRDLTALNDLEAELDLLRGTPEPSSNRGSRRAEHSAWRQRNSAISIAWICRGVLTLILAALARVSA
jgi:hypothetical protein